MRYPSLALALLALPGSLPAQGGRFDSLTTGLTRTEGFVDYYLDAERGRLLLAVPADLGDFIYVNSLAAGVGSNDLGLDRGQLGSTRLVRFERAGGKLLLVEPNLAYRATSDNAAERRSVEEAFATSVLGGFPLLAVADDGAEFLVDLTPWLLRDAHGVARVLAEAGQGAYEVDPDRSALYPERTRNFPRNTELEARVTLVGRDEGRELRSVTPSPAAVTTRQHHAFVALPPPGYTPRAYDVRSGYSEVAYADYAAPIGEPLVRRVLRRHRLAPGDTLVYYVDPGAPEPVRSALIEGAGWWDDAFQAAGFPPGTFRVGVLPEGADPLDVRYNVIQWVHRSTRGWSYGAGVTDPRTGEILKGHVSLGSLRVRQDYLIAQGLVDAFDSTGVADPRLLAFALARLRQLSAHEVGHTLGLRHNFAASVADRASVMDYPHPYVALAADGSVDLSDAYATGIGTWDELAIAYGYAAFDGPEAEAAGLADVLGRIGELGLRYVSDPDARAVGGAHPAGHLWDNGADAVAELLRIGRLRRAALRRLDGDNLAPGRPAAELEDVLAPLYLAHRYQVEAAAKLLGGVDYRYAVNGGEAPADIEPVDAEVQRAAMRALLGTLTPAFLELPAELARAIPPPPPGYVRDREQFASRTGPTFDPEAAAEASVDHTLRYLLAPERITRLRARESFGEGPDPEELAEALAAVCRGDGVDEDDARDDFLRGIVAARTLEHALALASDPSTAAGTRAFGLSLAKRVAIAREGRADFGAVREHNPLGLGYLSTRYYQFLTSPATFAPLPGARIPDGSPIGCGHP